MLGRYSTWKRSRHHGGLEEPLLLLLEDADEPAKKGFHMTVKKCILIQ